MYRSPGPNQLRAVLLVLFALVPASRIGADERTALTHLSQKDEHERIATLLRRYCIECHGADTQEANLRLDTLDLGKQDPRDGKTVEKILDMVSGRKMPPADAENPTTHERAALINWLEQRLVRLAENARRSGTRTRNRRLTVEEYDYTLQTLFGVDAQFSDLLPADPLSEAGFRNDHERLGLSSLQIEAYLDSARRAIERYVRFADSDRPPLRYHIEFEDLFYSTADRYGTRARAPRPVDFATFNNRRAKNLAANPQYTDPLGPKLPGAFSDDEALRAAIPKLNQQYVAIPQRLPIGELIVRVRAAGTADRDGRFPRMRVEAGITLGDGCSMDKRVVGEIDVAAPLNMPKTYEFRVRLERVPTKGALSDEDAFDRLSVFDMDQIFISNVSCDRKAIFALGRGGYSDPKTGSEQIADDLKQMANDRVNFLYLDCIEIEMLPGVGKDNRPYKWLVPSEEVRDGRQEELAVVREFLGRFMTEAFRRPVTASEITTKLDLFKTLRGQEYTFEASLRETLAAVLVSPSFLFVEPRQPANDTSEGKLTPFQLAARLSYLLWLSPPDPALIQCADDGSLMKRPVLRREAKRLLADSRSHRFLESFCRQWLRLDKLANVSVNRDRYPTYDDDFAAVSIRQTLAYFVEVFESDASALDLIDSNYAILNDRLADHYDVNGVTTGHLHKVRLPDGSVRGGLLTHASLMTINSDGVDSHPIRRGAWLLDRVLNNPPPPPPPNVPEIDEKDPDFRGLSLKERIRLHRQPGDCKNCHAKIDPWGIPFENLDATGRWRDRVEANEAGQRRQQPVDATALLPDGRRIAGIAELKTYLRDQQGEQFANALVHHMWTYAMGRPPDYTDRQHLHQIQERFAASQYRMKELVLAIVESDIFPQP